MSEDVSRSSAGYTSTTSHEDRGAAVESVHTESTDGACGFYKKPLARTQSLAMALAFADSVKKHMAEARAASSEEDLSGSEMSEDKAPPPPKKRAAPSDDESDESEEEDEEGADEDEEEETSETSTEPPGSDDDPGDDEADDSDDDSEAIEDDDEEVDEAEEDEEYAPAAVAKPDAKPSAAGAKPSLFSIVKRASAAVIKAYEKHGNLLRAGTQHDEDVKKAWTKVVRKIDETFQTMAESAGDKHELKQFLHQVQKCSMEVLPFLEQLKEQDGSPKCVVSGDSATHLFSVVSNPRRRYLDELVQGGNSKVPFAEWLHQKNAALVTYSVAVRHDCVPCLAAMLQLASFNDIMYKAYTTRSEEDLKSTFEATMRLCLAMA